MRNLTEVIIHCSATHPDWMLGQHLADKVGEIRRWHMSPPLSWSDIGYHYIIDRNGQIATGRPMSRDGAHVKGRNKGTVGICLLGGHGAAATDQFEDHFTDKQKEALLKLLEDFPGLPVTGHNQYANKGCPGFNVPATLKRWKSQSFDPAVTKKQPNLFQVILELLKRIFQK